MLICVDHREISGRLGEVAVDLVDKRVCVGHAGEGGGVGRAVVDEVGEGFYFGYESV